MARFAIPKNTRVPGILTLGITIGSAYSLAAPASSGLPDSGMKTPYSPLAVPTLLKPQTASLEQFLDKGYQILSTTLSGSDIVFTLGHRGSVMLCALTPPDPRNDRNVPTSRCWALNHEENGPVISRHGP